jgi:transposase
MIDPEVEAEILRLFHAEKWPIGTIATQLRVHHSVVRRVLDKERSPRRPKPRARMIDPYLPFIMETIEKYPRIPASRLFDMVVKRGYPGGENHFRAHIASLRPRVGCEAFLRLKTLPAEQAQVDWGHFGRLQVGKASRPLFAFILVLSYSRALFLRFFLSQKLSKFLYGHEFAFSWVGGVTRVCLYDNLRTAVLERVGQAIRFQPDFLRFAGHYRFEPRPVAPYRGNEKGRVERAVRFVRSRFFAARRFKDLDDLNRQALTWCETISLERRWPEDKRRTVKEVFEEEKEKLLPLPQNPYPCEERVEVTVGKSPYVRFDLNDYSVPHALVGRTVVVVASLDTVRILDGNRVVAKHRRSFDRDEQIEDNTHIETLAKAKHAAGAARRADLLLRVSPSSKELLRHVAERGLPLGRTTNELMELLRTFGPQRLEEAVAEALCRQAPHPQAVRHILECKRKSQGKSPARPLSLPDDPRVKNLFVKPHDLKSYEMVEGIDENSKKE